jgi:hypothetical protein
MCLKNRPDYALDSIKSLVNENTIKHFDFIISEDISENLLDLSNFKYKNHITHYIIDTGDKWNRSKTCNFGFKRAQTPFISSWDADFLFPKNIHTTMTNLLKRSQPQLEFLRIWCTETGECYRRGRKFKKNDLYGGMYVYSTKQMSAIRGYDEDFINYGWEEIDCNDRYSLRWACRQKWIKKKGLVYHKSHDEAISGDKSFYDINKDKRNKNIINRRYIVNQNGWGDSPLIAKVDYTKDNHVKEIKEVYYGK